MYKEEKQKGGIGLNGLLDGFCESGRFGIIRKVCTRRRNVVLNAKTWKK